MERLRHPVAADEVEGVVIAGTTPLAGAAVRLEPNVAGAAATRTTTTNAEGRFRFGAVESGVWLVFVEDEGFARRRMLVVLPGGAARASLVLLLGGGEIVGHVFGREGSPAANRAVTLVPNGPTRGDGATAFTRTDAAGDFRFDHVPSGSWTVLAYLTDDETKGADCRQETVPLPVGVSRRVVLGSEAPEPLWSGSVRLSSGTPLRGPATLWLTSEEGQPPVTARVGVDGDFSQRLRAGRYRVVLEIPLGGVRGLRSVPVGPEGSREDILVPGVRLAGSLRDAADGRVIPPGDPKRPPRVVAIAAGTEPGQQVANVGIAPDGTFTLDGVPPGDYRLQISGAPPRSDGKQWAPIDVRVTEDRDLTGLTILLQPNPGGGG